MSGPDLSAKEIATLTALRGIAASWVVIGHFSRHFEGDPFAVVGGPSHLAVDVFFVLSGFILFYVYSPSWHAGRFDYLQFLRKRFARIYPVHLVTLLIFVAVYGLGGALGVLGNPADQLSHVPVHLLGLHATGLAPEHRLNVPSWSISAEMIAYVLFPVYVLVVLRLRAWMALTAGLLMLVAFDRLLVPALAPHLRTPNLFELTIDFGVLRILPEFLIGVALARLVLERPSRAVGHLEMAAIAAAFVGSVAVGVDLLTALLVPLLIWGLYGWKVSVPRPLQFLGVISYSLYMVHGLVEVLGVKFASVAFGWADGAIPVWTAPLAFAAALVAAALLWRWVERPGQRWVMRPWAKGGPSGRLGLDPGAGRPGG